MPGYYTDAALICMQAKELGLNVPLFGGDGWESDKLTKIGKEAVEGTYFQHALLAGCRQRAMARRSSTKYKKRSTGSCPTRMAALGYDSAMMLADAHQARRHRPKDQACATRSPRPKISTAVTGKITHQCESRCRQSPR